MTDSVLVAEHRAGDGVIGQLTLNVEKTLNSLTREMVEIITDRLETWAEDEEVVAVFIDGAGEKAFCAGGDVQALRNSCIETPGGPCEYAEHFFAREYPHELPAAYLRQAADLLGSWRGHGRGARYSCRVPISRG